MTEEMVDPPTIKNAGKLGYEGADMLGAVFLALMFGLIAVGAMLHAILTSHGRGARGLLLNAVAGVAAIALFAGISFGYGGEIDPYYGLLYPALMIALIWMFLAVLAATVGAVFRPLSRLRRPA